MHLPDHPLLDALKALRLPAEDFAVFGSGPMWAHGIKDLCDLDVLARGAAWKKASELGTPGKGSSGDMSVTFVDGLIEVFDRWAPGDWDSDALIDGAEVIDGIRFVKLEHVLAWKRKVGRPKDERHVRRIEEYLRGGGAM